MIESISILSIGLLLLLIGSNMLVTSTENVARRFSISGFYASFFMIGIATSAPEIFISIESALRNKTILAIGNAFGSNISNLALVFCVSLIFIYSRYVFFIKLSKIFNSKWQYISFYIGLHGILSFLIYFFDLCFEEFSGILASKLHCWCQKAASLKVICD